MIGYLEVLGAVLIWAIFNGVLVKLIKTPGVGVGMWTGIFGIVVFGLMALTGFNIDTSLSHHQLMALIVLGVSAALNNSFNYTAIKISLPVALLFHYLAPPLVVVWYFIFPIEAVSTVSLVALAIALAGVVYMALPNIKEGSRRVVFLGAASAIFYSLEIVLSGYLSNQLNVPAATSSFTKLLFQAMVMPIMGLFVLNESVKVKQKSDWRLLILGGALLYFSFVLYFLGSATVGPIQRGVLGYIDRIGAIALGAYFFKEERDKITKNIWIGGALVLGAGLIIILH